MGKFEAAEQHLREGIAAWSEFTQLYEPLDDDLFWMAQTHLVLGVLLKEMLRLPEVDDQLEAASERNRQLTMRKDGASPHARFQKVRILRTSLDFHRPPWA
jgi:hypothetical protein